MRYDQDDAYDELYRFEAVTDRRYWNQMPNNVTWAPLIGVRRPQRSVQPLARAVGFSYELHTMESRRGLVPPCRPSSSTSWGWSP